tara:strand:- start:979 stop:1662 length:684 start_codon:yes stop_codon:yes gene_type:complete
MALKLLNPGLRPLGQFDLDDADQGLLLGGENVRMVANPAILEGYAADVGLMADGTPPLVPGFARDIRGVAAVVGPPAVAAASFFCGLADEGGAEYGTQFGSLIGQNAGRSTQFGTLNGAVVVGPTTDQASGKVTVWAQSGLYGVTDDVSTAANPLSGAVTNGRISATAAGGGEAGRLSAAAAGALDETHLALYVSEVNDTSLVSTTATAVGAAAQTEYHAIFHLSVG